MKFTTLLCLLLCLFVVAIDAKHNNKHHGGKHNAHQKVPQQASLSTKNTTIAITSSSLPTLAPTPAPVVTLGAENIEISVIISQRYGLLTDIGLSLMHQTYVRNVAKSVQAAYNDEQRALLHRTRDHLTHYKTQAIVVEREPVCKISSPHSPPGVKLYNMTYQCLKSSSTPAEVMKSAMDAAKGQYIVIWNANGDFFLDDRLEKQMEHLTKQHLDMSALSYNFVLDMHDALAKHQAATKWATEIAAIDALEADEESNEERAKEQVLSKQPYIDAKQLPQVKITTLNNNNNYHSPIKFHRKRQTNNDFDESADNEEEKKANALASAYMSSARLASTKPSVYLGGGRAPAYDTLIFRRDLLLHPSLTIDTEDASPHDTVLDVCRAYVAKVLRSGWIQYATQGGVEWLHVKRLGTWPVLMADRHSLRDDVVPINVLPDSLTPVFRSLRDKAREEGDIEVDVYAHMGGKALIRAEHAALDTLQNKTDELRKELADAHTKQQKIKKELEEAKNARDELLTRMRTVQSQVVQKYEQTQLAFQDENELIRNYNHTKARYEKKYHVVLHEKALMADCKARVELAKKQLEELDTFGLPSF